MVDEDETSERSRPASHEEKTTSDHSQESNMDGQNVNFNESGVEHPENSTSNNEGEKNGSHIDTSNGSMSDRENNSKRDSRQIGLSGEPEDNKPKKVVVDAVAQDGVLSLLTAGISSEHNSRSTNFSRRHRALSTTTREQLDSHERQYRFNEARQNLNNWLSSLKLILKNLLEVSKDGHIPLMPENSEDQFSVFKLNLKMGASSVEGAAATPAMLESRISQIIQHSQKLQERLEDTTSRVLITGDVNAGKSSLCNAFLRRRILPVDQQPCTDVFCEVIDASNNDGIEEVHAILLNYQKTYHRLDPSSGFHKFSLEKLPALVHQNDKYSLLKVYIKDPRPSESSLLNNGVLDICLIDAPGLNVNQLQTNDVFDRQEEIDLVIFVVSAENHFTQSSMEFVSDTAREKSLVFIVVNNFDRIRDQDRCRDRVLKQVADLAPETHKGAGEFVHFVSSSPTGTPQPGPSDDPDNDNHHGPGTPDFDRLEASLRNFVLQKRSSTKLAPARTYLLNVLKDLNLLATTSLQKFEAELQSLEAQLQDLSPEIEKAISEYAHVSDQIERDVERLAQALYSQSFDYLNQVVSEIGDKQLLPWRGLWDVFAYAQETRETLVTRIQEAIEKCEDNARDVTSAAVDAVKQLGIAHVGAQPAFDKVFQKSAMFSRKRDNLSRSINANLSVFDLFSVSLLLERPLPILTSSKRAIASSASWNTVSSTLTACSLLGVTQLVLHSVGSGVGFVRVTLSAFNLTGANPSKLVLPIVGVAAASLCLWSIYELPRTIPRSLARKIAFEIDELGYVRANADRISSESRKVLKYPSQDVRAAFQSRLESNTRKRDQYQRNMDDTVKSIDIYGEIRRRTSSLLNEVSQLSLEDVD